MRRIEKNDNRDERRERRSLKLRRETIRAVTRLTTGDLEMVIGGDTLPAGGTRMTGCGDCDTR